MFPCCTTTLHTRILFCWCCRDFYFKIVILWYLDFRYLYNTATCVVWGIFNDFLWPYMKIWRLSFLLLLLFFFCSCNATTLSLRFFEYQVFIHWTAGMHARTFNKLKGRRKDSHIVTFVLWLWWRYIQERFMWKLLFALKF